MDLEITFEDFTDAIEGMDDRLFEHFERCANYSAMVGLTDGQLKTLIAIRL